MRYKKNGNTYIIQLAIGEEIQATLGEFVRKHRIKSGWLQGIGAVDQATLGIYHLKERHYYKRLFPDETELVSMSGNISWLGKDPVLHLHAVLADAKLRAVGGHLFSARCAVTVEVMLIPGTMKLTRKADAKTGLNLLDLA